MASSNGTSSVSSLSQQRKYGSENGHLQQVIDERKRKRMISNRESARRSRMKKHKYLNGLMAQVDLHKEENNQIVSSINMVNQLYLNMKAENSLLKAQMVELSDRLKCLQEVINCMNSANDAAIIQETENLWNNSNGNTGDDFLKTWDFAPWESANHGLC